ncbi:cyclin-dependent kinase G-2-like [Cucumis melo var. makuwa]|uniref:Cyclin-dependent kinase G-2-like n=1 Tax=Cucumis melo var. makuwa TaxID=1194695 RepID=A0A5A7UZE7_CUCMM|nr:cyclin-dependent kinase G-2-like [Cucumis melo var. makuwa]TYK14687.1 cyclin-dependent kinase G-2-like [Cucumis melo var. makuwa]
MKCLRKVHVGILTNTLFNQLRKKFPATSFTGSPVLSKSGFDLLSKLLTEYQLKKLLIMSGSVKCLSQSQKFMPSFPAQHARDR